MRAKWSIRSMLASYFATIALGTMTLLDLKPMACLTACWFLIVLTDFALRPPPRTIHWKEALILATPFLIMLLDFLRSPMDNTAWRSVERSAALAAFPIGFLILGAPGDATVRKRMMQVFAICTLIFAVVVNIAILGVVRDALHGNMPFDVIYRSSFATWSGVHPPYAAYWFFTASLFAVCEAKGALKPVRRSWWMVVALLCALAGLIIGSRMPFFAFAIALMVVLFAHSSRRRATTYALVIAVATVSALLFVPGISHRITELGTGPLEFSSTTTTNSVSVRAPIIHCSFTLLEEQWLMGLGQDEVQQRLDACYAELGYTNMVNAGYGPHDQAMHWWLSFGIAGLAVFVLLFGWSMREAWRHKDHIHLAFLVFIVLCSFTEDLLTRQWGVLLFACFNTLFIASQRRTVQPG